MYRRDFLRSLGATALLAGSGRGLVAGELPDQIFANGFEPMMGGPLLTLRAENASVPGFAYRSFIDELYRGAFRIQRGETAQGSTEDPAGAMAYCAQRHSIFFAGHYTRFSIAEFQVPDLVHSTNLAALNTGQRLQPFVDLRSKVAIPDQGEGVRISGLHYHDNALMCLHYQFYEQEPYVNTVSFLNQADNLAASSMTPYIPIQGGRRASGWVSPVPAALQPMVGGSHVCGWTTSTNRAQEHVSSNGSPLFGIDADALVADRLGLQLAPTLAGWEFFPYANTIGGLDADGGRFNTAPRFPDHANKLWTYASEASYGVILPGTRTYAALGYSAGHRTGMDYYAPPWGHYGYNPLVEYDSDPYYWLFDVNDLQRVRNGELLPHQVMPYEYGPIPACPFQPPGVGISAWARAIVGGTVLPDGTVLLAIAGADPGSPQAPVIMAIRFDA